MCSEPEDQDEKWPELPRCRQCDKVAKVYMTKIEQGTGEVDSFHLCEEHAREYFPDAHFPDENPNPRREPSA